MWIVLHAFTSAVYFIAGNVVAGAIDIVCIIIGFMGIWLNYKLIMQRLAARRARKAVQQGEQEQEQATTPALTTPSATHV